jgi:dihydrofolate reductase
VIKAILACDEEWGIGKDGDLPWPHNSADLKWFKKMTLGEAVVMGRNTWNSLPVKPLPGRYNVVVSSTEVEGATYTFGKRFKERIVDLSCEHPVCIIGGAQLVESCLDIIDELWLSRIDGVYDCDTVLPKDTILEKFALDLVLHKPFKDDICVEKWVKK